MAAERPAKFGKSKWLYVDERLIFPQDSPPHEAILKSIGRKMALVLVVFEDGSEPYFEARPDLGGFVVLTARPKVA
jgi:hypothetical protein